MGVNRNVLCLTMFGPATAYVDLGTLFDGTYRLNLYNGDAMRSGELVVSSENYKINIINDSIFYFGNTSLIRYEE